MLQAATCSHLCHTRIKFLPQSSYSDCCCSTCLQSCLETWDLHTETSISLCFGTSSLGTSTLPLTFTVIEAKSFALSLWSHTQGPVCQRGISSSPAHLNPSLLKWVTGYTYKHTHFGWHLTRALHSSPAAFLPTYPSCPPRAAPRCHLPFSMTIPHWVLEYFVVDDALSLALFQLKGPI